jgi:hypothetical protein
MSTGQKNLTCFQCGKVTAVSGIVGRRDDCPQCRADLHVCKNCEFYDAKSYNECKEPQADRVVEKERANFCDHFALRAGGAQKDKAADLRAAAEALFKKN